MKKDTKAYIGVVVLWLILIAAVYIFIAYFS